METHDIEMQAALAIHRLLRELAEEIDTCAHQRMPNYREPHDDAQRNSAIHDAETHLVNLAEALYVSTPALFVEYLKWNKVLFAGLHLPDTILLTTLECMKDALRQRLSPEMADLPLSYLDTALYDFPQAPSELPSLLTDITPPFDDLARQYLEKLMQGRRNEATFLILSAVNDGTTVQDIYLRVFQPVMREVGRRWQMHEISVGQEHYITAATQLTMAQLAPIILSTPKIGLRLVATSVGGELHELGARMVADFFELDGWDSYYLGANTPTDSVIRAVAESDADVLVISATLSTHVSAVAELIAAVRASEVRKDLVMLVGGYPFNLSPDLWQHVGADGYAPDAQQAVDLANHLLADRKPAALRARFSPTEQHALPPIAATFEAPLYEEISKLNNELVTLHREVQKKNVELNQLIEDKNNFLSMAAHDLRNPLSVIQLFSELLLEKTAGALTASQRQYLEKIIRASQVMLKLVNDLLLAVQFESGPLQVKPTALGSLIRQMLETMKMQADEKRITLDFTSEPLPDVPVDPIRMEQAIRNLISNALKFSDPGSTVQVKIGRHDESATISVIDHGRGIPAERIDTLFTPFPSIDKTGTAGERGTGLGLAITKRIIDAHHGSIRVESEVGKGSTFVITLPMKRHKPDGDAEKTQ